MIDDVGGEFAGGGLSFHASDELPTRRSHHLDTDEGEALVEGLDDLLLDLSEVRRVVDELTFLLRRLDQLGRPKGVLVRRARRQGEAESGEADRLDRLPTCQQ